MSLRTALVALSLLGTALPSLAAAQQAELKVTIRSDQLRLALSKLNLPSNHEARDVYFFDTPRLEFSKLGLVFRARKVKDGPDDTTVKRRPTDAQQWRAWLSVDGFKCEPDVVGARTISSCSLTTTQRRGEIAAVAAGQRGIEKLYSQAQERFAGMTAAKWSRLRPLGPVMTKVWKLRNGAVSSELVAELWTLPNRAQILEVSTKVPVARVAAAQQELFRFLSGLGLDTASAQETKTATALAYFTSRR